VRLPAPPGRLIDIGGHRLHMHCTGDGPSVVFDAALGASSLSWAYVAPQVAQFARACVYDRAGFGWSDGGPLPRTAGRLADELRRLLQRADTPRPYVLVGHSLGAMTVRLFASRYPEDMAGLVLLDPADPQLWTEPSDDRRALLARGIALCGYGERAARLGITDALVTLINAGAFRAARAGGRLLTGGMFTTSDEYVLRPAAKLPPDLQRLARRMWAQPRFFRALGSLLASLSISAAEIDDHPDLGDLPVVVVSAGLADASQVARHADLAARSRRGRHVIAEGSGHWIPLDRPDLVAAIVREVVDAVASRALGFRL
jgi:pimeloyl-ACP methyl ester carboxylesterase